MNKILVLNILEFLKDWCLECDDFWNGKCPGFPCADIIVELAPSYGFFVGD